MTLFILTLGKVDSVGNMGHKKHSANSNWQWSVAVALVICAIFAAAIALKAKSDLAYYKSDISGELVDAAQSAGNVIDREFLIVRARLSGAALNDSNSVAGNLITLPQISDVSVFDAYGTPTNNSTASGVVLDALSAAAVLATNEGWFGTIALSKTNFKPALAIKHPSGQIVTATLIVPKDLGLKPNIYAIIADKNGHIVSASDRLKLNSIGDIRQALNFKNRTPKDYSMGEITSLSGEKYFIGTKLTQSGFYVYTLMPQAIYHSYMIRLLSYYALLFMGPILAYFGILYVIKDQAANFKHQQSKVRDAERRLKIAIEGAKCGIWEWDIYDDKVYLSSRSAKIFGFKNAGIYHSNEFMPIIAQEDRAKLREALNNAPKFGNIDIVVKTKFIIKSTDNSEQKQICNYIQLRGKLAPNNKINKNLLLTGVAMDVSSQIGNKTKVSIIEGRVRDVIEAISGPFAVWSEEGKLISWNQEFAKRFELEDNKIYPGQKYSEVSKLAAKAVVSQKSDINDHRAQELLLKDGTWLKMIERKTRGGRMISIGLDISDHKQTEAAMEASERKLQDATKEIHASREEALKLAKSYEMQKVRAEEASSAKSSFLANMSHELRTPLNAINGFSQIMADELYGPLGDKRYTEYSKSILSSGRHLLELINDVLDMAKIEAGKFNINPRNVSLSETISQVIHMLDMRAEEKNIIIETDLDDNDEIHADQRAVRQIIINLLSNSIKFTNSGGRILVRTREEGENIVLSVIDTGIGIDKEYLPRLGYAFEQVENDHAKASQGTGLGLALCRAFAEMHGGSINIISKIGVGTRVNITLPKYAAIEEAA